MSALPFQCECGTVQGQISNASAKTGTHAECFCQSCRAGELYARAPDPAPGPIGIFQTSPHLVQITSGQDKLAVFSFGEKNLLRWQAACCGSPLFNTPRNPKLSFVGIRTNRLADTDAIGPVVGQAFVPTAGGKAKHKNLRKLMFSALARIAGNRLSGRWKQTPFFDAKTGNPIAPIKVVSRAERKALFAT